MNAIQKEYVAAKEEFDADIASYDKALRLLVAEGELRAFGKRWAMAIAANRRDADTIGRYIDLVRVETPERDELLHAALNY